MTIEEGADTDLLPKEWPHAKYIADAGAYPAVETYFLGYLRYLGRAREHYPVLMDSIARTTVLQAKLGSEDSAGAYNERERASTLMSDLKSAESKLRAAAASGH